MLTIDEALTSIIIGVHHANKKYLEWSKGECVQDSGIESLISASVAEELYRRGSEKDGSCRVTMETSFEKIISATGVKALGARPKTLSQNQRADVVYWNKKENPIGVIEIKRHFDFHRFYPDIERTAKLLEKYGVDQGGTLRWGAIASLRQWWKGEKKDEHDILDYFLDECVRNFPNFKFDAKVDVDKLEPPEEYEDGMVFYGYRAFAVLFRLIRT